MGNARGSTTRDTMDVQRTISDYYKQLTANTLKTIEEMNKCTELLILPELTQEETDQLNNLMSI